MKWKNTYCGWISMAFCTTKDNEARLLRRIYEIPDSFTRLTLSMRLVDGMQWAQIAAYIGQDDTPDSVRHKATRRAKKYGLVTE